MFCPNCGAKNGAEQKFCRSCGMNLEQTAVTLADQFGADFEISSRSVDRFFNSLGKFAFGGFGTVLVIGIGFLIYSVISKFIVDGSQVAFGVFLILFLIFASLSLVYVIYNESKKDKKRAASDERGRELSSAATQNLLSEPSQMPIPSVVDDTTELLRIESKTRRLQ